MKTLDITFCGCDWWARPTFKDSRNNYFCNVDILCSDAEFSKMGKIKKAKIVSSLIYKGSKFDSEPMGTLPNVKFNLI